MNIKHLLAQNTQELSSILKALEGRYVSAAPGGDLLRDGAGVLPTGQFMCDPYEHVSPAQVCCASWFPDGSYGKQIKDLLQALGANVPSALEQSPPPPPPPKTCTRALRTQVRPSSLLS